jgi:dephospho-CoA kinase
MHKIGLTGGICTGKTFILNIFKELDCYTLRADEIAKPIIFDPDSQVSQEIVREFGEGIYDEKKGLKKEEFTRILFEDIEKRNFVNNTVHPLVGVYHQFHHDCFLVIDFENFEKKIYLSGNNTATPLILGALFPGFSFPAG